MSQINKVKMLGKQNRVQVWLMIAAIFSNYLSDVQAIDKGEVIPNSALSSPSQIRATKKSSLWLHWNYTYGGDSSILKYKEQIIGYKSRMESTLVPLAKRNGPSGTLVKLSPIAGPFSGRIDVIQENSTLVVHNLRFNDSGTNFSSYIDVAFGIGKATWPLIPVVTVEVMGAPEFTLLPPSAVTVAENSKLEIRIQMDGNPKPSAIFQWPHDSSKDKANPGTQLYPYIYESTYSVNNIPASFCGRILTTKVRNSVGTSATIRTNLTVLPAKIDANPNLQAGKLSTGCVEVKWNQLDTGICLVKYEIQFKAGSDVVSTNVIYNTGWITVCFMPDKPNITNVQFTMSFKTISKTFTAKVSESPIPTTHIPTIKAITSDALTTTIVTTTKTKATVTKNLTRTATQGKGVIVGLAVVVAIETTFIVIIIAAWFVEGKRILQPAIKKEEDITGNTSHDEMHYMDLKHRNFEADSNYASLQPQYEEVGKKEIEYENVDRVARI